MTSKSPPMAFQPAPRPRPLNTPDATAALQESARDLGFARPTSAPPAVPSPALTDDASKADNSSAPRAPEKPHPIPGETVTDKVSPATAPAGKRPSVRIELDDKLWDALRMEALKRRVTVKYLIYEALAAQGFEIDMASVPEDGRRAR